jgi:hypothetical protein
VPRGSHGLAQPPAGVSVYHVAPPVADAVGAVVVVVVGGGGGAAVVVVGGEAVVAVVVGAAPVDGADATGVPPVDVAAIRWSLKRTSAISSLTGMARPCPRRTAAADDPVAPPPGRTTLACPCNRTRGTASIAPLNSRARPTRLPPIFRVLRTPPFSGDSGTPHAGHPGRGFVRS